MNGTARMDGSEPSRSFRLHATGDKGLQLIVARLNGAQRSVDYDTQSHSVESLLGFARDLAEQGFADATAWEKEPLWLQRRWGAHAKEDRTT